MTAYILDTNTISLILRQSPAVLRRFEEVLIPANTILGCPLVWYEIRRGLLARDATSQIKRFDDLFGAFIWQDYNIADWLLAAKLWADRRAQGKPVGDADLLIAVYAYNRSAVLVTDNERDFANLGVRIENWARTATS